MAKIFLYPNLQLFAEGEGSAPVAQDSGESVAVDAEQQDPAVTTGEADTTADSEETRKAEFERLIKEEYKDLFTEKTQSIINKRFKKAKSAEERLEKLEPLVTLLSDKYGTEDLDDLLQATSEDTQYLEQLASEEGLSVEQYKHIRSLERENETLRDNARRQEEELYAKAVCDKWLEQAYETQEAYPDFDLSAESENDDFTMLLHAGIPVKTAYEVVHHRDIVAGAVQAARKAAVSEIQSSNLRPGDGGVSSAGVLGKKEISALTTSEMEDIERRVLRGERIKL